MTLVKNNPRVANNIFDELFFNFPTNWGRDAQTTASTKPPVNIHESAEGFTLELSVPGRNKEDFKIHFENGLLTIAFEKAEEKENTAYKTIRREFSFQSFKRSFTLDETVNADGIQAKYDNGVLALFIPKKEEVKVAPKQITIL